MKGVGLHPKDTSEISLHVIQDMKLTIIYKNIAILVVQANLSLQKKTAERHAFTYCRFKATINSRGYPGGYHYLVKERI